MFTLYVDGIMKNGSSCKMLCNATQCVSLLAAYCRNLNINLCIIDHADESGNHPVTVSGKYIDQLGGGFKIPDKCFCEVSIKTWNAVPEEIHKCNLPAIIYQDQPYIISGLCHILRFLIKKSTINPSKGHLALLGHKQCCLKATFEISSRTNLCEVTGPAIIDDWLSSAHVHNVEEIPEAIEQFENLMNQPVVIHNRDKRQRVVLERLTQTSFNKSDDESVPPPEKTSKLEKGKLKRKLKVRTNDLPPLEHAFAEGIEFMLSDLALLPLVHSYLVFHKSVLDRLSAIIPLTLLWYHRLQSIPEILKAAESCAVELLDVQHLIDLSEEKPEKGNHVILKLGKEKEFKSLQHLSKKDWDKTIRRDLPTLLERINKVICVEYKNFESEKIHMQWEKFPDDVHPIKGELSSKRASRKCQQIENLLYAIQAVHHNGDTIVDFCAGGGHVGIVVAYMLPKCKVVLVENKEESLDRARMRIQALSLKNISVHQCNLENYRGNYDIGLALHACGIATDMVLRKCVRENASFIVSPCCYGRIQNTQLLNYPQSKKFQTVPVTYEELMLIGRGGDQTSWNFDAEKSKQGKLCMGLMDMDRTSFAREEGYETTLYSLQPHHCSPKNNLIVGVLSKRSLNASELS